MMNVKNEPLALKMEHLKRDFPSIRLADLMDMYCSVIEEILMQSRKLKFASEMEENCWIMKNIRNKCARFKRIRRQFCSIDRMPAVKWVELSEELVDEPFADKELTGPPDLRRLYEAIDRLPGKKVAIFCTIDHYVHGYTRKELCDYYGIDAKTLGWRLRDGKRRLAKMMYSIYGAEIIDRYRKSGTSFI